MATQEHVRLLIALKHKVIEEVPDYEGDPSQDYMLQAAIEKFGDNEIDRGPAQLVRIPKDAWNDAEQREQILTQIKQGLGYGSGEGLGDEFYDLKNTFRDDAMACFKAHHRNPACNDYKSNSKRLTPQTQAARKAAGLPPYRSEKDRYLCEHCVVHSLVQSAAAEKAMSAGTL